MTAKHLIVTLSLTLAAGATLAAIKHGHAEAPGSTAVAECAEIATTAIPRVIVTARRDQARAAEAPVARVVVTARRIGTSQVAAAATN